MTPICAIGPKGLKVYVGTRNLNEAGYILNDLSRNQKTVIHWYKEYRCRSSLFKYWCVPTGCQSRFRTFPYMCMLRECQHSSLGSEHDTSRHVRKVRQYFILCQLPYCANPKQPPPLHHILADVMEVCGGLWILNRLGCTRHTRSIHNPTCWGKASETYMVMPITYPRRADTRTTTHKLGKVGPKRRWTVAVWKLWTKQWWDVSNCRGTPRQVW